MDYTEVIVDVPTDSTDRFFHYRIPAELKDEVYPGRRVLINFGNRKIAGFVWKIIKKTDVEKVKDILSVSDPRISINSEFLSLIPWFCTRYYCRYIEAINMLLPPGYGRISETRVTYVTAAPDLGKEDSTFWEKLRKRAPKQYSLLQIVAERDGVTRSELLLTAKATSATLNELVKKKMVFLEERSSLPEGGTVINKDHDETLLFDLTSEQQNALEKVEEALAGKGKKEFLIHGVTGSGKTEVYLLSIKKCLAQGKSAMLLVPEIALTPQMVAYFKDRLPGEVALMHSNLPVRERYNQWFNIKEGRCRVVMGTRSAVFTPVDNLGLVIVDEEQESSYKQEESPRYHAREVARWRASYHDAVFILGSATPAMETYWSAEEGELSLLKMKKRATPFQLPEVHIVDMRQEILSGNRSVFSRTMSEKLGEVLGKGQQALLFINRRGFSNFILCRECGFVVRCPHCSVSLTYHSEKQFMVCHYCSHISPVPETCPECRGTSIRYFGAGTQRIAEELNNLFPGYTVLRMDRDSTSRKGSHRKLWDDFRNGRAQVMVGTQMVAKGLDFPGVTLVGVVAADTAIHLPDFRAAERTFQLVTQVSGRAGRGSEKGEVVVQTYHPAHHSIECVRKHDYESFFHEEIQKRKELLYPPFSEMLRFLFISSSEKTGAESAAQMAELLKIVTEIEGGPEIMGPAPAPLFRIKGYFRHQLILRGKELVALSREVREIITTFKKSRDPREVRLVVDYNPQMML